MVKFRIYVNSISLDNLIWQSNAKANNIVSAYGDSILSPKIKKELNKADGFDFTILPSNGFYDSFEKKKTFVFVTRDGKCIFHGRVSDVKTDIFKQRTVTCEGAMAFLADSVQKPNKKTTTDKAGSTKKSKRSLWYFNFSGQSSHSVDTIKMSVGNYFRALINSHNSQLSGTGKEFTVGSITVSERNSVEKFERTSFQDTSSIISSDLLSVYGGVIRTRYKSNKAYIDWLDDYTDVALQEIRYGVNLIELDQEPPSDDVWSVLLAVGDDNVTIADANNGSMFLENRAAINKYGYIVHYHHFSNVKKAAELKTKAQRYLNTHGKIFPDNLIVKAIDLEFLGGLDGPLEVGEKIRVVSESHDINTIMSCISMEIDILSPENSSYTIGTIMPPDKEKKKDSLSSKHASSHSSAASGFAGVGSQLNGYGEDINVNSNNINVNAENIAVNALNIAVNAENIAVVAKNIAVAAETIDVKAQRITETFGEETEDLHGTIERSAEGIKQTFTDNTTGLTSTFSQTGDAIIAEISTADGNVKSYIELTEDHLKKEFNKKIYGDDGEGGIVADYKHRIHESGVGTVEYFQKTLYGDGGTEEEPTATSFYYRVKTDTAALSQDIFQKTLYGTGTADNPDDNTILTAVYRKSADEFLIELYGRTDGDPTNSTGLSAFGKLKTSFSVTGNGISMVGKEITLDGWVKATQFSALSGDFRSLVSGTEKVTHLSASTVSAEVLQVYRSAGASSEYKKYYVSMAKRGGSEYYQDYVLSTNSSGTLDLSHSHSVTTGTDGTITIGGAVATDADATVRSFKIADTKTYKDGVSAAASTVTVTRVGFNTTDYPEEGVSVYTGSDGAYLTPMVYFPSSNDHHTRVRIRADASNGKHREAGIDVPGEYAYSSGFDNGMNSINITDLGIDPSSSGMYVSDDGKTLYIPIYASTNHVIPREKRKTLSKSTSFVTVDSVGLNTIDYPGTDVGDSAQSTSPMYYVASSSDHYTRVRIRADASNGQHREQGINVPGTKAYNDGKRDCFNSIDITSVKVNQSTGKASITISTVYGYAMKNVDFTYS